VRGDTVCEVVAGVFELRQSARLMRQVASALHRGLAAMAGLDLPAD
jgi:hypothetical protein